MKGHQTPVSLKPQPSVIAGHVALVHNDDVILCKTWMYVLFFFAV